VGVREPVRTTHTQWPTHNNEEAEAWSGSSYISQDTRGLESSQTSAWNR